MLTAQDIALVRASFAQVVPIQETAASLFYNRLFAIAPGLRRLFPTDLTLQKRKLMQTIAAAVGGLDKPDELVPAVRALGARHAAYGVTVAHYGVVGQALIWTLERGLGDAFTMETRAAWAKLCGVLAATRAPVLHAADEARPAPMPYR